MEKKQIEITKPEETIDNQLELLKYLTEVQSRIKDNVNSDFVLAILNEKDREGITEMTGNAYFTHKLLMTIAEKAKVWNYNHKEQTWYKIPISNTEKELIKTISKKTFDMYMTRIYMTTLLNRNVPRNHLMNLLAKEQQMQEEEEPPTNKIQEFMKKFENKKENE